MREQNRKNTKSDKNIEDASAANDKKTDKERIKELAKKKQEMQEELDELRGNTAKGKAVCALVFFRVNRIVAGNLCGNGKVGHRGRCQ